MAGDAAEHRFDHHTRAGIEGFSGLIAAGGFRPRRDLVARDEGEADQLLEVSGAAPVESGQVRPADARQEGPQRDPVVSR